MIVGSFCVSAVMDRNHAFMSFGQMRRRNRGNPKGRERPRGTRPCLQGLVCYTFCGRRRGKGCRPAFGGIAFRAAGSGRARPAHRQRTAADRKRTERNLRAAISEKFLFRPGRRRYIKNSRPRRSGQTNHKSELIKEIIARGRLDCHQSGIIVLKCIVFPFQRKIVF